MSAWLLFPSVSFSPHVGGWWGGGAGGPLPFDGVISLKPGGLRQIETELWFV